MNKQPTIMEAFDRMENKGSNNETKEVVEKVLEKNIEQINNSNEIVEVRYDNEIYKVWKVEFIRPLIRKFLKEKYPESLIVRELNDIDMTLFDNKSTNIIPIEIQRTSLFNKKFRHTEFEDSIRRQLEDNITNYGICYLFFDYEYIRFLQSYTKCTTISINLTWIVKLMRENILKVFAIRYDGETKELTTKDFDFLKVLSQTCPIGYDSDERILNRNKLKIFQNVIRGYNFTQEEITQFENEFDSRNNKESKSSHDYFIKSNNERCRQYGNILGAFHSLQNINKTLSCTLNENEDHRSQFGATLGLFYRNSSYRSDSNAQIQFIDKFDIAQYFPGYLRNKEMWDYCKKKQRIFKMNEFRGIIKGYFNYEFIKKQSTMADY